MQKRRWLNSVRNVGGGNVRPGSVEANVIVHRPKDEGDI